MNRSTTGRVGRDSDRPAVDRSARACRVRHGHFTAGCVRVARVRRLGPTDHHAWFDPAPLDLIQFTEQAAYIGAGFAAGAWVTADNFLQLWSAFDQDDVPGSALLTSLPVGGIDRYSASVSLSPWAAASGPWILAFDEEAAIDLNDDLWGWGFTLYEFAYELADYIDGSWPDAAFATIAIGSALYLAWEFQNLGGTWCGYVVGGGCFFHDGFIPTSRQNYLDGLNTSIPNGPSHTYQTESATVADYLRARVEDIL